jgi:hypothetical protein
LLGLGKNIPNDGFFIYTALEEKTGIGGEIPDIGFREKNRYRFSGKKTDTGFGDTYW